MYNKCMILKLDAPDPGKELEFELAYQRSLTTEERFRMLRENSSKMLEIMVRNGHRKPFEITKRS
ncbi:MAG: hypothetical protein PHQ23_12990 [Candidatus Wallbacteria bacterium]|nr:hypothetical protein [Candidatus Wallbacteria bacterium]